MAPPSPIFCLAAPSLPANSPITFPRTVGQIPIYYAHLNTGRPPLPSELGIPMGNPVNPVGYRSKYVDVDFTPEYPFGFGLSYTNFEYSNVRLSQAVLRSPQTITASAEITNKGARDADEIVQLYVHEKVASVVRPVRELKGFRRIHLNAGQHTTVSFPLKPKTLPFGTNSFISPRNPASSMSGSRRFHQRPAR